MAIESEMWSFAVNNGVGVVFGFLMWLQANTAIKENTKVTIDLKDAILKLSENLNGKIKNN